MLTYNKAYNSKSKMDYVSYECTTQTYNILMQHKILFLCRQDKLLS